jgi:hypothetical protein
VERWLAMEVTSEPRSDLFVALRRLLFALFALLVAFILVVVAHSALSNDLLFSAAQVLGVAFVFLAGASALLGAVYAWRKYPQHHRAIQFVAAITLITLLAHLYIVGSPAASTGATVSGAVGTSFGDKQITVSPSVTGQVLSLDLKASGADAIADVSVALANGGPLSGSGFASPPTFSSPLQPGGSVDGTWTLPSSASSSNISVSYQYLTCYSTSSRSYGCIMDEVFYVPEAMGILSGQHCSTTATDCHMEHPPLSQALDAAGMAVFGEFNVVGWRIMPILLGTFTIPLLFVMTWKASGSKKIAYVSAMLLALDVMFFSQSSAALLDVPEVFFGVAAFFVYFANLRFWKLDKFVLAGILLGIAGLAKETAVFFALGFLTYVVFFDETTRKERIYDAAKVALVMALVFIAGLQTYDSTLATPVVPTFYQHVSYILSYGSSLIANKIACQPTTGYWCKFANDPGGPPILPTDWIIYYSPVAYYATSVSVCPNVVNGVCQGGQYSYVAIAYYGITNLLETWTVFVWIPLVVYLLYRQFRRPQPVLDQFGFEGGAAPPSPLLSGEVKFAGLALVWFLWAYLPYIALFLAGRVTYPFYFVPAIPAVAMGCAYWVTRSWFPRPLLALFMVMIFVFFFIYFPDKGFLPDWLRVLIGH